ncbi:hypothetical protein [Vallitalea okinawensis]|uniref:hypothetical protein n=1 Tax=Vallitalea okinawensis TaxID=2078660 RepID=UPI000CFAAD7D|nr:hypothetical protein [Vallitalea okinawensis]
MPYPESLKKSLEKYHIDHAIIEQIYEDYENITDKSSKKVKIPFMRHAMKILDENLDDDQRYEVIDACACCLGGARQKNVKKFSKSINGQNMTLLEKVDALREAHPFQNYATRLNEDGTISDGIYYEVNGKYKCACPCLNKEKINEPISSTYCLCCAGHFRHHIQDALGIKLRTKEVVSSAIESLENEPCVFTFEIIE